MTYGALYRHGLAETIHGDLVLQRLAFLGLMLVHGQYLYLCSRYLRINFCIIYG